jgi:hypothetical protein
MNNNKRRKMMTKPNPLETIENLIHQVYPAAKTVFWAGSVSKNQGTLWSDLDLVIVYENVPHAYREAFVYQGWCVDAFIHDPQTLDYFFEKLDKASRILALPTMVAQGIEVPVSTDFGNLLKFKAQEILNETPQVSLDEFNRRRFAITDHLQDLEDPKNTHEYMATLFELYKNLAEFYLLSNKCWLGGGKQLVRALEECDPQIAKEFLENFTPPWNIQNIKNLAHKILSPRGGLLWDGFKSNAPLEWRSE